VTLDPVAFAAALRKGLGRCVVRARAAGDPAPLRPLVLAACREHQAYDPQIEGTRTTYLLELARAVGALDEVRALTLDALPDDDSWDAEQHVGLAAAFAREGDRRAARALAAQVRNAPTMTSAGAALVEADGEAGLANEGRGLLYVARLVGERCDEGDAWVAASAFDRAAELFGEGPVTAALARVARTSPPVARFAELARAYRARSPAPPRPPTAPPSFDPLLADLAPDGTNGRRPGRGVAIVWGRRAPPGELARAAEALAAERSPARQEMLLATFFYAPFPAPPERLFDLTRSAHGAVADAAFRALAALEHPALRPFALACLAERPPRRGALQLLSKNGAPGDGALVVAALAAAPPPDDDARHDVGLALLNGLAPDAPPGDRAVPLAWVYEHTPCSHCRNCAVRGLVGAGALAPSMRAECPFDCDLDTRALVRPCSAEG
jgi:hypothetical protein